MLYYRKKQGGLAVWETKSLGSGDMTEGLHCHELGHATVWQKGSQSSCHGWLKCIVCLGQRRLSDYQLVL